MSLLLIFCTNEASVYFRMTFQTFWPPTASKCQC